MKPVAVRVPVTVELTYVPSPCPACGTYSIDPGRRVVVLFEVANVLVLQALTGLGRRIVRAERGRFALAGDAPRYLLHTVWLPDDSLVTGALGGAWDVVPAVLSAEVLDLPAGRVVEVLDAYARHLALTGTPHARERLADVFRDELGLPIPEDEGA